MLLSSATRDRVTKKASGLRVTQPGPALVLSVSREGKVRKLQPFWRFATDTALLGG